MLFKLCLLNESDHCVLTSLWQNVYTQISCYMHAFFVLIMSFSVHSLLCSAWVGQLSLRCLNHHIWHLCSLLRLVKKNLSYLSGVPHDSVSGGCLHYWVGVPETGAAECTFPCCCRYLLFSAQCFLCSLLIKTGFCAHACSSAESDRTSVTASSTLIESGLNVSPYSAVSSCKLS